MSTTKPIDLPDPDSPINLDDHGHYVEDTLYNKDLRPTHPRTRTWKVNAYLTLWVAMCINPATWTLAASLIALGMNWLQALFTVVLGNLVVLVPMVLNGHAGAKHGISYPVFARAAYGVRGATLPAIARGLIACGWFGIQTWFGALALNIALGAAIGPVWSTIEPIGLGPVGTVPLTTLACYVVCLIVQLVVVARGFESLRQFQAVVTPIILGAILILVVVLLIKTGGEFGPVVSQPSQLGWGAGFWRIFPLSLMANIAFWSTLSMNMPDFTRFAVSQRTQFHGQAWGLPVTMLIVSLMAILATSLGAYHYGVPASDLWNPDELVQHFGNRFAVIVGALVVAVSTFQVNTAANLVSPALDFANSLPKYIDFRRGALVAVFLGTLFLPWKLLASPNSYIFVWLGFYGGVMGAFGGVIVADYWLVRKTNLSVPDLYKFGGRYHFSKGWNLRAVIATALGAVVGVGGAYSSVGPDSVKTGPFPVDGVIPVLKAFYDYNWVVAFLVGMGAYWVSATHRGRSDETIPFDPADSPVES